MSRKWVDNEVYFGPDRRLRGLGKRWGDRRQYDDAGDAPPLGAVLRRMRVMLVDLAYADRSRFLQLATLAIREAERLRLPACADAIKDACRLVNAKDNPRADAAMVEAMNIFSSKPRE